MDERIIECVRAKELLYNPKLKEYKSAPKKQEVWEEIAAELEITAKECKSRWNLLRNAYIHAISRRKTVTGHGVKNLKKWKFQDEMAFLLPFLGNRNTVAAPVGEFSQETKYKCTSILEETLRNQQNKKHLDNYQEDKPKLMKARFQETCEKNDIDLFFNCIAETVKKFPKLEQVKLKSQIMNMVNEVEIEMCMKRERTSVDDDEIEIEMCIKKERTSIDDDQ